jgi:calcineurin-like phosphoesterase family protein
MFVIADTHFGCEWSRFRHNRPFADTAEMNAAMIYRWNDVVNHDDTVIHLGDFSKLTLGLSGIRSIVASLNGRKWLCPGNHDTKKSMEFWIDSGFERILPDIFEMNGVVLSHRPLRNASERNVHGHLHALKRRPPWYSEKHICVSVEMIDYKPVKLWDLLR